MRKTVFEQTKSPTSLDPEQWVKRCKQWCLSHSLSNGQTTSESYHRISVKTLLENPRALTVRVLPEILNWLSRHIPQENLRNELLLCFQVFMRQGYFSIHTGRFQAAWGGHCGKRLRDTLKQCPYIRMVKEAKIGSACRRYRFQCDGLTSLPKQSTDSTSVSYRAMFRMCQAASVVIPGSWLVKRSRHWLLWCQSKNLEMVTDLWGISRLSRATLEAISGLSLSMTDCNSDPYLKRVCERFISGTVRYYFKSKDGRSYHPLTNCSKSARRVMRLDDQPLREADLSCSHWYLLASQLDDPEEKSRLISIIHQGDFYERVAKQAGVLYGDRSDLKKECQRQLLFGRDWRQSKRPLWKGLATLFPQLCRLIEHLRSIHKVTGFAKHLMRLEGMLMNRVHHNLLDIQIPSIRLHDGMLVAEQHLPKTIEVIERTGAEVLGIKPRVTGK